MAERENVKRWFAHTTGNGEAAVQKMVALFLILVEANPKKNSDNPSPKRIVKVNSDRSAKKKEEKRNVDKPKMETDKIVNSKKGPDVFINLQVHISPDATSDQIEKIFENMAKHIYRNN